MESWDAFLEPWLSGLDPGPTRYAHALRDVIRQAGDLGMHITAYRDRKGSIGK